MHSIPLLSVSFSRLKVEYFQLTCHYMSVIPNYFLACSWVFCRQENIFDFFKKTQLKCFHYCRLKENYSVGSMRWKTIERNKHKHIILFFALSLIISSCFVLKERDC